MRVAVWLAMSETDNGQFTTTFKVERTLPDPLGRKGLWLVPRWIGLEVPLEIN